MNRYIPTYSDHLLPPIFLFYIYSITIFTFFSSFLSQEDVETFLIKFNETVGASYAVEAALGVFNELYSKYKYMEASFEKSKNVYKAKVPEIEQTIELIKLMIKKHEDEEEMITNYNLCDTLYAVAKVFRYYRYLLALLAPCSIM